MRAKTRRGCDRIIISVTHHWQLLRMNSLKAWHSVKVKKTMLNYESGKWNKSCVKMMCNFFNWIFALEKKLIKKTGKWKACWLMSTCAWLIEFYAIMNFPTWNDFLCSLYYRHGLYGNKFNGTMFPLCVCEWAHVHAVNDINNKHMLTLTQKVIMKCPFLHI